MKNLTKIVFLAAAVLLFCGAEINAQTKCFQNQGLKSLDSIEVTIKNRTLTGTYLVSRDQEGEDEYAFTGKLNGSRWTVTFADGKMPPLMPPKRKSFVWTLSGNNLKVPFYGKNSETNKYAVYSATFEPCGD